MVSQCKAPTLAFLISPALMTAPGEAAVPKSKFLRRRIMTAPLPARLIEQSPRQVSSPTTPPPPLTRQRKYGGENKSCGLNDEKRGGTGAETNVAEKKGKKTIKLLASREQISPEAAMIFRLLFDILPSAGLPSLFV